MKAKHEVIDFSQALPFRCYYSNNPYPNLIIPHFHPDLELIYLLTGSLTVTRNNQTFFYKPNDLILFNPNEIHSILADNSTTTAYVIQVSHQFIETLLPPAEKILLEAPPNDAAIDAQKDGIRKVQTAITHLFEIRNAPSSYSDFLLLSQLAQLLYLLYHHFGVTAPAPSRALHKDLERIHQIDRFIKDHFTHPISLEEIAGFIGFTPSYFSRFFKNAYGLPFSKYLNALRLEHACRDILTTTDAILDISERNGFANYQLFSKSFKIMFGCSPLAYRKAYSAEPRLTPAASPASQWQWPAPLSPGDGEGFRLMKPLAQTME